MKKFLSLLLSVVMVLSLVACSNQATTATEPVVESSVEAVAEAPTNTKRIVKVGVSIYTFADAFMTLYRNEIEKYFRSLNTDEVEYQVTIQDAKNDQGEQSNQIENFINQKYDVLILNLVQSTAAQTVMQKCADAGIPTVFINREPSEDDMKAFEGSFGGKYTYVGADARQSGKFQGELIADLPNKGDLNGDGKLQYVMIEGDPENVDAQYRTEFSISQYKEVSGLDVEQLDDQIGNWQRAEGQRLVENALTQYGNDIEVVFCNNDDMALGAKVSIEAAGRTVNEDIYLVGVDALEEAVDAVIDGKMTGTVLNDHVGQSHQAVDCAVNAANGQKLSLYYWVDYVKVTPENASQFQ